MKLTKYQKARLLEHEWDVVETDEGQNCSWISVEPEDGEIFNIVINLFGLTGEGQDVKLLVVATREELENENN
tara:strand:- start:1166 stop:1384 length:219 start_codon:yes stop_codon:yes gene_type:complete